MIVNCPNCSKKNRIPEDPRTDGVYKCGDSNCQTLLLYREIKFHDKLIKDVMNELIEIRENLESIKFPMFHLKDISDLKVNYERSQSKIQNWLNHIEYLKNKEERAKIYSSYQWELQRINKETTIINYLIDNKESIKRLLQKFSALRQVFGVLNVGLKLTFTILGLVGFELAEVSSLSGGGLES